MWLHLHEVDRLSKDRRERGWFGDAPRAGRQSIWGRRRGPSGRSECAHGARFRALGGAVAAFCSLWFMLGQLDTLQHIIKQSVVDFTCTTFSGSAQGEGYF